MSNPSSSSIADWQSLKAEGNQHFKAKNYSAALQSYNAAISELNSRAPSPQLSGDHGDPPPPSRDQQLALLYSNVSAAHFNLDKFAASLKAAEQAIELDPAFLKARLRKALALEKLATTGATTGPRTAAQRIGSVTETAAQQLHDAVNIVQKIRQILQDPSSARGSSGSVPSLTEVNATLTRLRASLAALSARAASPLGFLSALQSNQSQHPRQDLLSLMRLVSSSSAAKAEALGAGLVQLLLHLSLDSSNTSNSALRLRAAALRALRHLLSHDLAAAPESADTTRLDVQPLREAVPQLVQLYTTWQKQQSEQSKQVPPPLPPASHALASALTALSGVLARLAVLPRLANQFTISICTALQAPLPRQSAAPGTGPSSVCFSGLGTLRAALSAIEAITYVSSSPGLPHGMLRQLRSMWLPLLLLGSAAEVAHEGAIAGSAQLRAAIVAAVAVLTRNSLLSRAGAHPSAAATASTLLSSLSPALARQFGSAKRDGELSDDELQRAEEEGAAIKSDVIQLLYEPLMACCLGTAPSAEANSTAGAGVIPVRIHFGEAVGLVRALSLLLQANTQLGIYVVSYGAVKDAPGPPSAVESKQMQEQKSKEGAENEKVSSTAEQPADSAKPTVLQLLLSLSSYVSHAFVAGPRSSVGSELVASPPKLLQLLAAEVLALSSSDSTIRATLGQLSHAVHEPVDEELREEGIDLPAGKGADVFLDLIVQYADWPADQARPKAGSSKAPSKRDPSAPISNSTIVAHACLALAKLVAVGEWGVVTPSNESSAGSESTVDRAPEDSGTDEFALLLHVVLALIERHKASIPRLGSEAAKEAERDARRAAAQAERAKRKAAAEAAGRAADEELDDDDLAAEDEEAEESLFAESGRMQDVALLHVAFEALSYLSMHAYSKRWIVTDSGAYGLKLLVSIAVGAGSAPAGSPPGAGGAFPTSSTTTLGPIRDATLRYALVHVFRNLCTSRESLEATHNAEVDELKKLASRGLEKPGSGAATNEAQNTRQKSQAGGAAFISSVMKAVVAHKGITALVALHRAYVVQQAEFDNNATNTPSSASSSSTTAPTPVLSSAVATIFAFTLLQLSTVVEARGSMVQQGCVRLLLDLYAAAEKPKLGPGGSVLAPSGESEESSSLNSPNSPYRCSQDCAQALARVLISVNPVLISEAQLPSCVLALLEELAVSEHELAIFETLLALTNLASYRSAGGEGALDLGEFICIGAKDRSVQAPDTRPPRPGASAADGSSNSNSESSGVQLNGWYLAKAQLSSANMLVQRASVELMTNLVNCNWVRRRLRAVPAELRAARGEKVTQAEFDASYEECMSSVVSEQMQGGNEDIRLLLAFALSDDLATARAATGALAMLASDPLIAARIAHTRVVSYLSLEDPAYAAALRDSAKVQPTAEELVNAPAGTKPILRTGESIAKQLLDDPATHDDVRLRLQALVNCWKELPPTIRPKGI